MSNQRLVLDSCVIYEALKKGQGSLRRWIADRADRTYLAEPVVLEFLAGCENQTKQMAFEEFVSAFDHVALQPKDVQKAKAVLKKHRPRKPVTVDSLIACIADKIGARVVTYDLDDYQSIGANPAPPESNI